MLYGDVCTGISAPTVAWSPLGWKAAFYSEIEPFPCRLLKHYYPDVPNLGDMTKILDNQIFKDATIDLLVGGTPCQSFSLAGLRAGLDSENGNLALQFCRILDAKHPRWFVWENVPGVFSSFSNAADSPIVEGIGRGNGRYITETSDFATILTAFRECGYSCAWRVCNAEFFGVPQRRRRVFVVGYLGNDWRPPAAVLFDSQSVFGNIETGTKKGKEVAGTLDARTTGGGFPGSDGAMNGHIVPCWWDGGQTAQTLDAVLSKGQTMPEKNRFPAVLVPQAFMPGQGSNAGSIAFGEVSPTLKSANSGTNMVPAVLYPLQQITSKQNRANPQIGDPEPPLTQDGNVLIVPAVRRITPTEAEFLQGFPRNYTAIPKAKDSPRYKAIGNSMAVPVLSWIGRRIDAVDKLLQAKK